MENNNNHKKEPQDSVRKKSINKEENNTDTNNDNKQANDKIPKDNNGGSHQKAKNSEEEENKIMMDEEENQKIKNDYAIQEALKEKSKHILNFSSELDNILASIITTWEKFQDGYDNFYNNEISPKFDEYLNYPCITVYIEKIILIFRFFCKYFLARKNCLKEMPIFELNKMMSFIFNQNYMIFSRAPNHNEANQNNNQLIDDRYFYQVFKELLPENEVENYYGIISRNCMYKYFIEFLLQCGYMDAFIDNVLTRSDINPWYFAYFSYFPFHILNYCEKDFIIKKNYNIKVIKIFNEKIDFYLSDKNPMIKVENEMYQFANYITNVFIDSLYGIFNHVFDELKAKYSSDCDIFTITVFKLSEFFLKHQKINMKMSGMYLCSHLCNTFNIFYNQYDDYKKKYNDIDKIYNYATNCAVYYLNKINIFDLIFGENIHEGLIQRSYSTLSFLYRRKSFTPTQIKILWKLSITKYQSISNSIITLFGQLLPEFTNEDCNSILNNVLNTNPKEVNETTLKLLENFCGGNERRELLLNILFKFSNELYYEKGLSKNIIIKSRKILVKLLFNTNYKDDLVKCVKQCIFYINEFYLVSTYSSFLSEIFDKFNGFKSSDIRNSYKSFDGKVEDFGSMISYLDENFKLFPIFMNYLVNVIKTYKFFFESTINIVKQIEEGNFDYDKLLNIDTLYNYYNEYIKNQMNYYYNLNINSNSVNSNSMDIDFDVSNNSVFKNNENQEQLTINKSDHINYIKNIIRDYVLFFKQVIISNNILPSFEEIKKDIFEKLKIFFDKLNFSASIKNILNFIYNNHIRANNKFKISYLNFLYNLGLNTQDIIPTKEWYYNLLSDLFSSQINSNNNLHLLTDENLEYLLKEHIVKTDYIILPVSAFTIVNFYTTYFNQKKNNATFSPLIQKYTHIRNLNDFEGLEYIWNFFLKTKNEAIYKQSLNVLMNIIELTAQNVENRNFFINKIFNFIQQYRDNLQNEEIKTAFIRNLKLISVTNGTKITKTITNSKDENDSMDILIKNYCFGSQDSSDNNIKITIKKGIKINDFKEYLINSIICSDNNLALYNREVDSFNSSISDIQLNSSNCAPSPADSSLSLKKHLSSKEELQKEVYKTGILLNYKNKILEENEYTLADYKVEKDSTIIIFRASGFSNKEYVPTPEELQRGYQAIMDIFGENLYFNEEVMKASIIKHRGNAEEAALYLTNPDNVKNLQKEMEEKKKGVEQKEDEIMCLEEDKIIILIDILSKYNDEEISNNIWQLFSEIKYPDDLIKKIIEEELVNILAESNLTKLILFLRIINSIIFDDDFIKFNKIKKEQKNQWISKFIKNENIIKTILLILSTIDKKVPNHNHVYQIINIFMDWIHKILLKICELVKSENLYADNALAQIKRFRDLNSKNNDGDSSKNNNNNSNSNMNDKDDKNKNSDQFEITNKDDASNFLKIIYGMNGTEIFYQLLLISFKIKIKAKEKENIVEKMYEIILIYILIKTSNISIFNNLEKDNQLLFLIMCKEQNYIVRKMTLNFIKVLLNFFHLSSDKKEIEDENNIFSLLSVQFIKEMMNGNGNIFNEQCCELFGMLLVINTNKLIENLMNPLIYQLLNNIYDLCLKLDQNNMALIRETFCKIYLIYCCMKFYKNKVKNVIDKLLNDDKKDFIQLIYNSLFEITKEKNRIAPYKFINQHLREYSFKLLAELIKNDKNYLYQLMPKVLSYHKKLTKRGQDDYQTPFDVNLRLPQEKLVGLRNFGATCYLNSLFQQMFMIPSFRHDILSNFLIKYKSPEEYRYSVIYNMQISFQNLISGLMSPYPPYRFIKSFISAFNEQPIPLGVQQDSDEFLAILCDNLEKEAKTFGKENFLENSFKGKISNEILSLEEEFPYYSQSEEPFYRITLDIKGHKSLEEALDAYVKGEILEGENKYYVEKYKKKISIRKSSSIKKLGNEVIIHLKRFEFDFYYFTNNKLNDYIKFPQKINLKKWTRAHLRLNDKNISKELLNITKEEENNLIDENMDYILTGILVHGGSSLQSGHYYSFILDQETGKWHQFNDNKISDYDIERDLEKDCFGNISSQNSQYNNNSNNFENYSNTAYLLFYTNKRYFRNKELLEKINTNEIVLNDVFNENVNFLNMYMFRDPNYYLFIQEFANSSIQFLEEEFCTLPQNQFTLSSYLIKEEKIYNKVLSVMKGNKEDDNDSIDEKDNNENNIIKAENFEQILNKSREEIELISKQEKDNNKKNKKNIYTKKSIIKLYFNYLFGIIFENTNNNQNFLNQALKTLNNILENNMGYSLWILKKIEKHIDIFTNLLFRFGTMDNKMDELNQNIIKFFNTTFDCVYKFEKENFEINNEEIKYFMKDDKGNYTIVKEYKSIIMRLTKKLFCENLEKSRIEYAKNSLFLILFYIFVNSYPEISSVCVNYLPTIISLISNNTLSEIKSEINPNYLMGNSKAFNVNNNYIIIFCDILLNCVTPGMENTNSFSPFFKGAGRGKKDVNLEKENLRFNNKYPRLPPNWEKMLSIEFFLNFVMFHYCSKSKEIICHLCYGDEKISLKIMGLLSEFIKSKSVPPPFIEKVFINALSVFELKDPLEFIRVEALFQLNQDENNNNQEPTDNEPKGLLDYFYEERESNINLVLYILYNIGKAIEKYEVVRKYFENNKNKITWIKYFLIELESDPNMKDNYTKNNACIISQHPDLIQVIQESIIKKLGIDDD